MSCSGYNHTHRFRGRTTRFFAATARSGDMLSRCCPPSPTWRETLAASNHPRHETNKIIRPFFSLFLSARRPALRDRSRVKNPTKRQTRTPPRRFPPKSYTFKEKNTSNVKAKNIYTRSATYAYYKRNEPHSRAPTSLPSRRSGGGPTRKLSISAARSLVAPVDKQKQTRNRHRQGDRRTGTEKVPRITKCNLGGGALHRRAAAGCHVMSFRIFSPRSARGCGRPSLPCRCCGWLELCTPLGRCRESDVECRGGGGGGGHGTGTR